VGVCGVGRGGEGGSLGVGLGEGGRLFGCLEGGWGWLGVGKRSRGGRFGFDKMDLGGKLKKRKRRGGGGENES